MRKQRFLVLLALACILALMLPLAVSAAGQTYNPGWNKFGNKWSFLRDGQWVTNEVIKYGANYYGFDEEGYMITNEQFYWNANYYSAEADGVLRVNEWYQKDGEWYYYGAEGKGAQDFLKLGGKWYFFFCGHMETDTVVWSNTYNRYYVINKAGTDSKALFAGWNGAFGDWYYGYMDEYNNLQIAYDMLVEYMGKQYWFAGDGKMAANEMIWNWRTGINMLATADGSILQNGWAQVNGRWYYATDYQLIEHGIHNIGGKYYFFENCQMCTIPGELDADTAYYVNADGTLMQNQWRNDTIGDPNEIGWAYYGADSRRVKDQVVTIGNTAYYFNYSGIMQTKTVCETYDAVYVFDKDGKGTVVNGWFQHPETKERMYAEDGYLAEGVMTIGSVTYAFSNGYMVTEDYYYDDGTYAYYLFDKDGKLVTKTGFVSVGGHWYYVANSNGELQTGWKQSGKNWYCLTPTMCANTVFQNPGGDDYYAADNNGVCTQLTGSGWRLLSWGRVYLKNGKPIIGKWEQIGTPRYYFDSNGAAVTNDARWIGGNLYLFDADGKMVSNGWYKLWDADFYVDANGVAVTGLKTIGGKQYLFSENGNLCKDGVYEYEGTNYWLNTDGTVRATVKDGWNQIGGKWYYMRDGELLRNCLLTLGDTRYGFGSDYAMCTNGVQYAWSDYYMFDANGKLLTGWQKFDGKWYYADPESSDPYIYNEGVYWINGKNYLFKDGCLFVGSTMMYGTYYTTDSNGVVTSETEMKDGWNYTGTGYRYLKNGEPITGWVGDYYVEYGEMRINTTIEYGGKYYYLGADGRYIKNGWYKTPDGAYIYANSNGTLKCSEWLQLGGKYYYFYDIYMVADSIVEINGQVHEFDANGVWLGQVYLSGAKYASMSDGWHKISGEWYYYHAGARQFGNRYIGGAWYYFSYDDDGAMLTNGFDYDGDFYYGSTGARAAYTGWKKIDGYWIYFDANHSVHNGWIKSGNGWYYTKYTYDEDREEAYCAMVANEAVVYNGQLYCFNASGYCAGAVTGTGWKSYAGSWYYLVNGRVIRDNFIQIGKDAYYFDYEGKMVTNGIGYAETVAGYGAMYFGADGKAVRTAGWKQTENGWIYIGTNGFLYRDGIYRIGGKDYSFLDTIWVQK